MASFLCVKIENNIAYYVRTKEKLKPAEINHTLI